MARLVSAYKRILRALQAQMFIRLPCLLASLRIRSSTSIGWPCVGPSLHSAHGFDNGVRVGELAGGKFGMDFLAVDSDFESAPAARHELERANVLLELQ
jgi:hypothetical protein